MGFFDDINKKTNDMMELNRINSAIADSKRKITSIYTALGEKYYAEKGNEPDGAVAEFCAQITAELAKIDEYQAKINEVKNIKVCPQCGTQGPRNLRFCGNCGYNFPVTEVPTPPADAMKFCSNCGVKIPASTVFCPQCGTKQQ